MAKSPNWTQEEIDILKDNYPRLGKCGELAALFPSRNLSAVTLKASRLGLKVLYNIREGRSHEEYLKLLEDTNFECLGVYSGSTQPILHKCNICGHRWNTRPQHALKSGAQCPICDLNTRTNNLEYVDSILDKAKLLRHSDYLGSLKPITLEHLDCGYVWTTKFSYIQQGSGCPLCNKGFGYDLNKDNLPNLATIYLLKITTSNEVFLKVGITCRGTNQRVREIKSRIVDSSAIVELIVEKGLSGIEVLRKEKDLLNRYTKHKSNLVFPGDTELLQYSDIEKLKKEFE